MAECDRSLIIALMQKKTPSSLKKLFAAALLVALALGLAGAPATFAQTKSLYWERFDVDIVVEAEGTLLVTETQTIRFTSGTFTEGFAQIPLKNTDGIGDVVVSENGQEYDRGSSCCLSTGEYSVDSVDSNIEIVWHMGRTEDETRTFELQYRVHGAIRRYEIGNEFQWNAVSPGLHDFEIRESTVTVRMPPGAPISYADYLVRPEFSGVPMAVQVASDGLSATWVAAESLAPSEGIQIVVQFPPNTVGGGAPSWQAAYDLERNWETRYKPLLNLGLLVAGLLLTVGGPALLYLLWFVRGRDPQIDAVPEHITAPPSGLMPGIAGTLVDETADVQDIIATLMDLARRGYLVFEESSGSSPIRLVTKQFTLRSTGKAIHDLNDFEKLLHQAIFKSKESVRFSDLNQRFYSNIPRLQQALYNVSVAQGYFPASPESVRGRYGCLGWAVLILTIVASFFVLGALSAWVDTLWCAFAGLGLTGLVMIIAGRHMPAKTRKGAEAAALSRAFKNYLQNLEKYADPATVTDQFDKYLPFAIAFGLDKVWVNRFKRIPATPIPGWYYPVGRPYPGRVGLPASPSGAGGLVGAAGAGAQAPSLQQMSDGLSGGLQSISDGLNSMLNSAAQTLTSTPPSSSSGTSSGGRSFSGGGGGFRSSGGGGGGGRGFR